jgi:glutamate synthase domain-containing protein 1
MCGIVGSLDKSGASRPVGATLLAMLTALGRRGPDSAGVAVWGQGSEDVTVRVALPDGADLDTRARDVVRRARALGRVRTVARQGPFLRLEIAGVAPEQLVAALERGGAVEVVSLGHRLEIVKQVGAPQNLDDEFGIAKLVGSHGLGHTRLSTESRVDLSHSQPFWAHGCADLAVVHNGHITNYHRLRRIYEQEGVRFYTENDSEIIGVYLGRKFAAGASLPQAMRDSVRELDGSFSYLAATAEAFGFAKDPYCLKPLLVAETEHAVAIANEEVALHAVLGEGYRAREAGAGEVLTWTIPLPAVVSRGRAAIGSARRRRRAA